MIYQSSQSPVQQPMSTASNNMDQDSVKGRLYDGKLVAIVHPVSLMEESPETPVSSPRTFHSKPVLTRIIRNNGGVFRLQREAPVSTSQPVLKRFNQSVGAPKLRNNTSDHGSPPVLKPFYQHAGLANLPKRGPAPEILPVLKPINQNGSVSEYQKQTSVADSDSSSFRYSDTPDLIDMSELPDPIAIEDITSDHYDPNSAEANNITNQIHNASGVVDLSTSPVRTAINFNDPDLCEQKFPGTKHLTMEEIKKVRSRRETKLKSCAGVLGQWMKTDSFSERYEEDIQVLSTNFGSGTRMYELAVTERLRHHYTALMVELWKKGRIFHAKSIDLIGEIRERTAANVAEGKRGTDGELTRLNDSYRLEVKNYADVCSVIGHEYVDAKELYVEKEPGVFSGVLSREIIKVTPGEVPENHKAISILSISQHSDVLKSFREDQQQQQQQQVKKRNTMAVRNRRNRNRNRAYPY